MRRGRRTGTFTRSSKRSGNHGLSGQKGATSHLEAVGLPNLGEDPLDEPERQEGVSLEIIPRLEHRIYASSLAIRHRRKINLEPMVERGGEQVHSDRPTVKELHTDVHTEGPFRSQDLGAAAAGVRQDVEAPRHKLGEQTNSVVLAEAKNSLGHGVEGQRASAPFLAEVRKRRHVVREK